MSGDLYGKSLFDYIFNKQKSLGYDPYPALAVVPHEGGFYGAVGDSGTSFGPWQLHQGGALPAGMTAEKARQWANSPAGIDYALDKINRVSSPYIGTDAVYHIVTDFERPANPSAEIDKSVTTYFQLSRVDAGDAADFWSGKGGSVAIGSILGAGAIAAGSAGAIAGGADAAATGAGATFKSLLKGNAGKVGAGLGLAVLVDKFGERWLIRAGEMLAGGVLIVLGIVLVGKTATSTSPAKQTIEVVNTTRNARAQRQYRYARSRTGGPSRKADLSPKPKAVYSTQSGRRHSTGDDIPF